MTIANNIVQIQGPQNAIKKIKELFKTYTGNSEAILLTSGFNLETAQKALKGQKLQLKIDPSKTEKDSNLRGRPATFSDKGSNLGKTTEKTDFYQIVIL